MNYVEYNGLNKPRIIVIKASETSQCNEWSTNHTRQSDNVLLGMLVHSGRPRGDTWDWKEKGDYKQSIILRYLGEEPQTITGPK